MSYSQLTFTPTFFRGVGIPPTSMIFMIFLLYSYYMPMIFLWYSYDIRSLYTYIYIYTTNQYIYMYHNWGVCIPPTSTLYIYTHHITYGAYHWTSLVAGDGWMARPLLRRQVWIPWETAEFVGIQPATWWFQGDFIDEMAGISRGFTWSNCNYMYIYTVYI